MTIEETQYPEIKALKEIYKKYNVTIRVSKSEFLVGRNDYPAVLFKLKNKTFNIFVDDEYNDLPINNPLLSLCLVLRELEDYEYANDYLIWCIHHTFESTNTQVKKYHTSLENTYNEVTKILEKIDSKISDYDFELNAGAAQKLRKKINN